MFFFRTCHKKRNENRISFKMATFFSGFAWVKKNDLPKKYQHLPLPPYLGGTFTSQWFSWGFISGHSCQPRRRPRRFQSPLAWSYCCRSQRMFNLDMPVTRWRWKGRKGRSLGRFWRVGGGGVTGVWGDFCWKYFYMYRRWREETTIWGWCMMFWMEFYKENSSWNFGTTLLGGVMMLDSVGC